LEKAFLEWMERLKEYISTNGEHGGGDKSNIKR
jgi:hypothetical protein